MKKHAAYTTNLASEQATAAAGRAGLADVESARQSLLAAQSNVAAALQNVSAFRDAVASAQANVAAAETNVQRYKVLTSFREIRAPYAGVITARGVEAGALIGSTGSLTGTTAGGTASSGMGTGTANGSIFTIARLDHPLIVVQVPQDEASGIRAGQPAEVVVRELPGRKFTGTVIRTTASLDASTRTLLAEVAVPNPDLALVPGMYAQVKLEVQVPNPPPLIPAGALITDAHGTRVATVENDRLKFVNVEVGRDFGQSLEITSGLHPGEPVMSNPTDDLRAGMKVRPISLAPAPPTPGANANGSPAKAGGAPPPVSPFLDARKQEAAQGGESESALAQPGGVAAAAAKKGNGSGLKTQGGASH